jgi:hypothetical protein
MDQIKFGTTVRADERWGTLVSISKTHYGVKFSNGDVVYFLHALVSA